MNHGIKGRKLGRTGIHKLAMLRNLAVALLTHEAIKTTLPKAKELRPFVEKIITLAKKDSIANRRLATSVLNNNSIIARLFKEIGPKISNRNGGYTRILKIGFRPGDKAQVAMIELVDRAPEAQASQQG